jgi:hypothetical protein
MFNLKIKSKISIMTSHFENLNYGIVTGTVSYETSEQDILKDEPTKSFY